MAIVFCGTAGAWVFCASAVNNNRTKKISRMAMRRSISGSFVFVKASMNTPAGQFCATVDSSPPCPRLPSAFPPASRLTADQSFEGWFFALLSRFVNHLPRLRFSVCRGRCRYSFPLHPNISCRVTVQSRTHNLQLRMQTWLADLQAVTTVGTYKKSYIASVKQHRRHCEKVWPPRPLCRFGFAVCSSERETTIATVKPTDLLGATGLRPADALAHKVEREIVAIIDEA